MLCPGADGSSARQWRVEKLRLAPGNTVTEVGGRRRIQLHFATRLPAHRWVGRWGRHSVSGVPHDGDSPTLVLCHLAAGAGKPETGTGVVLLDIPFATLPSPSSSMIIPCRLYQSTTHLVKSLLCIASVAPPLSYPEHKPIKESDPRAACHVAPLRSSKTRVLAAIMWNGIPTPLEARRVPVRSQRTDIRLPCRSWGCGPPYKLDPLLCRKSSSHSPKCQAITGSS